jgi:hypothetical protein
LKAVNDFLQVLGAQYLKESPADKDRLEIDYELDFGNKFGSSYDRRNCPGLEEFWLS